MEKWSKSYLKQNSEKKFCALDRSAVFVRFRAKVEVPTCVTFSNFLDAKPWASLPSRRHASKTFFQRPQEMTDAMKTPTLREAISKHLGAGPVWNKPTMYKNQSNLVQEMTGMTFVEDMRSLRSACISVCACAYTR